MLHSMRKLLKFKYKRKSLNIEQKQMLHSMRTLLKLTCEDKSLNIEVWIVGINEMLLC